MTGDSLSTLVIPAALKVTKNGDTFLWGDSGKEDRILMFSTTENFQLLKQYRHWMVDGTFDICPRFFCQLFSVHAIIHSSNVPLVYGLLPNKEEVNYYILYIQLPS